MKYTKHFLILFGIGALSIIGIWIYFVGFFSSVYPPLEEYYFDYKINDFEYRLKDLNENQNLTIRITDTTGKCPTNYSIYFKILDENNIEYHLKYQTVKSIINGVRLELDLLGIFDKDRITGGYRISDSDSTLILIKRFEENIIDKINN